MCLVLIVVGPPYQDVDLMDPFVKTGVNAMDGGSKKSFRPWNAA